MFLLLFVSFLPFSFFSSLISFKAEIIWLGITRRASIIHLAFADTRNAFVISMHVVSAARRRCSRFRGRGFRVLSFVSSARCEFRNSLLFSNGGNADTCLLRAVNTMCRQCFVRVCLAWLATVNAS